MAAAGAALIAIRHIKVLVLWVLEALEAAAQVGLAMALSPEFKLSLGQSILVAARAAHTALEDSRPAKLAALAL
jgi:hypothetical protein